MSEMKGELPGVAVPTRRRFVPSTHNEIATQ